MTTEFPSETDAARVFLLAKLGTALEGLDEDYGSLVKPDAWKNTFLTSEDLTTLRRLRVSWKNGQITRLLGEHVKKMRDAGVELAEGPQGLIIFQYAAAK